MALCALAGLAVFAAGEIGVRWSGYPLPEWYPRAVKQLDGHPAEIVFPGSSQVFAAIDLDRFVRGARPGTTASRSFNFGQGYATIIEHAMGLRELARRGLLRGTVVFIEAPGGLPDTSTWRDRWFYGGRQYFLLSVIRSPDLGPLWQSSMTLEEKLSVSAFLPLRSSLLFTYREDLRIEALGLVYRMVERFNGEGAGAPVTADLRAGGGVRVDTVDASRIRATAIASGRLKANAARMVEDWEATVVASIVRTVQAAGGTVVFYDMPLSSALALESVTAAGLANRAAFAQVARAWRTVKLSPSVTFDDSDFPDLWHLSQTESRRFTDALVAAWKPR